MENPKTVTAFPPRGLQLVWQPTFNFTRSANKRDSASHSINRAYSTIDIFFPQSPSQARHPETFTATLFLIKLNMSLNSSPFGSSKRKRAELEEGSPSGKRSRTFHSLHAVEQPQQAPPTANFASTLAQQRQEALEKMEFGAAEREDCEMDSGNVSDESTASNPNHPWNLSAPSMAQQPSFNSLSNNSSVASSSMPGTPLDGSFNYATTPSYPSNSNPTSFTDMNGNTLTFPSNSPPLSVHPSLSTIGSHGPVSHGFVAQAHANAQAKLQSQAQGQSERAFATTSGAARVEQPVDQVETLMTDEAGRSTEEGEKPRVFPQPSYGYGWDYPRQSNAFALGGHLD